METNASVKAQIRREMQRGSKWKKKPLYLLAVRKRAAGLMKRSSSSPGYGKKLRAVNKALQNATRKHATARNKKRKAAGH